MTRTVSVGTMIQQLSGMLGTPDLTDWEFGFVSDVFEKYCERGQDTKWMSGKQLEIINRIYQKHFA